MRQPAEDHYIVPVMSESPQAYRYRRIVQAKQFIDTHYHAQIDLDNIADTALFSKYHFIRLFKSAYGKTPHQYLTAVRLKHAQKLLSEGESVSQTCLTVGFESSTTFAALFKRHVGCSPQAFQRKMADRKAEMAAKPLAFVPGCFVSQNGWD